MKMCVPFTATIVALAISCSLATSASAGSPVFASAEALLRGGSNGATDQDEGTAAGVIAKTSGAIDFARKTYFQFNVAGEDLGQEATLNFDLLFDFPQVVQTWALDQAYPSFAATETWDNAQANDVASPMLLLTTGPNTATKVGAETEINGIVLPATISIPLGSLSANAFGDVITLALTGIDDLGSNGGLRIIAGSTNLTFGTVPEPTSLALFALGGLVLSVRRRNRCQEK